MLLGESLCLPAYLVLKWVVREHPERLEGEAKPVNPLVLWPVGLLVSTPSLTDLSRQPSWTSWELPWTTWDWPS